MEQPRRLDATESAPLLKLLHPSERARYERLVSPPARQSFLLGRVLLRVVLTRAAGYDHPRHVTFTPGEHGKLRLDDPKHVSNPLFFNLAHCPTHLAVALSLHGEVGVDVETVREFSPRLPRRFFRKEEADLLEQLPPDLRHDAFFHLWVIKEACIKATGGRLAPGLASIPASLEAAGRHGSVMWEMCELARGVKAAVAFVWTDRHRGLEGGRTLRLDPNCLRAG